MKKLLLLFPILFLLTACGFKSTDNLIELNENAVNGVVQIVNSPDGSIPAKPPGPNDDENDHQSTGIGTGFIIKPNVIVTNYHVIAGDNRTYTVMGHNDLKRYKATLIAGDPDVDIAIIKLDDWDEFVRYIHPPILHWGSSNELKQGQSVWAIGHPYGLTWTLTDGIVSSVLRGRPDSPGTYYIQTNTSINPGNSGGPLFNRDGDVVGINSAIFGSKGFVGLTIPSDYAKKVVEDLLDGGKVKSGAIGLILKPSNDQHHIAVAAIKILSNSIAAGLLPDDIILQIKTPKSNGWIDINSPEDLQYETKLLRAGDPIELYTQRDQYHMVIKFTMADLSAMK